MSATIVVVDDSEIASALVTRILEEAHDLVVAGRFASADALVASGLLVSSPVVLLDLWMPGRPGLAVIRDLAASCPVIVVSDVDPGSPIAEEALAQGAIAFFSKRDLINQPARERLRTVVRRAGVSNHVTGGLRVVAFIGSTGGPRALETIVPGISQFPAAFVFIQHLPVGSDVRFSRWLTQLGLPSVSARSGDRLVPSRGLLAPTGSHLLLTLNDRVRLSAGAPDDLHVPSGDALLKSATLLGPRLLAVVLSGMGRDGAEGVAAVVNAGALCLAQDPNDCPADSMPRAALATSARVRSVPLSKLAAHVGNWIQRP